MITFRKKLLNMKINRRIEKEKKTDRPHRFLKPVRSMGLIHLIIFLSGFTFLIYEVVWNRMLSLVLGATVSAATIVLVSFMAGFGIRAFYWGRYANTTRKTGKLLSLLLLSIGLLSLLNYFFIRNGLPALYNLLGSKNLSLSGIEIIITACLL